MAVIDERYVIKRSTLEAIANAIRSKTGKTDDIPVPQFAPEIESIVSGEILWDEDYIISDALLISFVIDDVRYYAEEYMTWQAWLESDYNTTGATQLSLVDESGNEISMDSVIILDGVYTITSFLSVETEVNDAGGVTYIIKSNDYTTTTNEAGGITYDIGGNQ